MKAPKANFVQCFLTFCFISGSKNLSRLVNFQARVKSLSHAISSLKASMRRTLAPLRRIVARDLEVLAYSRTCPERPSSFLIHDSLECGHTRTLLSWDVFDLLCAYSSNPEVSARRHRCQPCLTLLAKPKPVQSLKVYEPMVKSA